MIHPNDDPLAQPDLRQEDDRNARAEMAWHVEPHPVDPMIELAAGRQHPPGHIVYLGDKVLRPYRQNP